MPGYTGTDKGISEKSFSMKLMAISDMHGNLTGIDPSGCGICVIAGDFAELRNLGKWHVSDQRKWIQNKFIPWIKNYPGTEFVIVPGNHDMCMDPNVTSRYPEIRWDIAWPSNAHILIDRGIEIAGLKIYGTPHIPIISHVWAFEQYSDSLTNKFSRIPAGLDILVTHTPPRIPGYNGDISLAYGEGSEKFGSVELAQSIFMRRPKHVFFGHIHTGEHNPYVFEGSTLHNVSRVDEAYEIAYEPYVTEI